MNGEDAELQVFNSALSNNNEESKNILGDLG